MDVKSFYKKLRETESGIVESFPVVASLATGDGGKEGILTETPRWLAARMITEGQARLALPEEVKTYRDAHEDARRKAAEEATATKVQIAVMTPSELSKLKGKG